MSVTNHSPETFLPSRDRGTTDSITDALCRHCVAAVVIDAGRIELAHEADCPADTERDAR